eukprot:scaffold144249_cov26-Cyclotella_meneghiniana.AAC.1
MKLSYLMTTAIPWHLTIPTLVYASRPSTRSLLQLTDCPSTCSPALCDCVSNHSPSSCASEVHSVCSSEKVNHCVPTEAVGQFRSLHCPFAACLVDGRSEEECECELLGKTCETFEENDMGFCEMAKCCKEQMGDDGIAKCLSGELGNDERPSDIEFDGSAIGSTADKLSQSSFEMGDLSFIPLIDDLIPVTDDLSVDAMDTLVDPILTPTAAPNVPTTSIFPLTDYCPEPYDDSSASSYTTGTRVQVDGYIYECFYDYYCKFPDYQPVKGDSWSDVWTEISPCASSIAEDGTVVEIMLVSGKASKGNATSTKASKSEGPTILSSKGSKSYSPSASKSSKMSKSQSPIVSGKSSKSVNGTTAMLISTSGKSSKDSNSTSAKSAKSEGPTILS